MFGEENTPRHRTALSKPSAKSQSVQVRSMSRTFTRRDDNAEISTPTNTQLQEVSWFAAQDSENGEEEHYVKAKTLLAEVKLNTELLGDPVLRCNGDFFVQRSNSGFYPLRTVFCTLFYFHSNIYAVTVLEHVVVREVRDKTALWCLKLL